MGRPGGSWADWAPGPAVWDKAGSWVVGVVGAITPQSVRER